MEYSIGRSYYCVSSAGSDLFVYAKVICKRTDGRKRKGVIYMRREQVAGMNLSYRYFSFDYFLCSMEKIGFKSIELYGASPHFYTPDLTKQDIIETVEKVHDHGLYIICYTPEQCSYPENIAAKNPVARQRSIDFYRKTIDVCAELGSPQILMTSGWGYFDESAKEAWERSRDSLALLAEEAEQVGVTIVLEPLRVEETNLVTTLPLMQKMMKAVDSPALKGMLDTSPMYNSGETIADYMEALGDDMRHIHFVDGDPTGHLVLGSGIFPLQKYIHEMETYTYQYYLTIELTAAKYFSDPHASMVASFQYLEPYFED